jgi:hypothetical protein
MSIFCEVTKTAGNRMEVLLFKNTLFSHFDHLNRTLHYDSCSVWQGHKPFEEESHVEHILYHKNKKGGVSTYSTSPTNSILVCAGRGQMTLEVSPNLLPKVGKRTIR